MNVDVLSVLQSPDDGTPIRPDLTSEGGIKYERANSGVLLLHPKNPRPSEVVYSRPMFERWNSVISERMRYYTREQSVAGLPANWAYRSLMLPNGRHHQNTQAPRNLGVIDVGCGETVVI